MQLRMSADNPSAMAQVLSLNEQRMLREGLPILEQAVRKILRRVAGRIQADDLRSIGNEALVRLVRRFDPDKSPLQAFLRQRLHFALLDGIRTESHSRVVVARARAYRAAERVAQALEDERRERTVSSLSALSGTDELPSEADYQAQLNLILREQAAALGISLISSGGRETAKADSSNNPEKAVLRAAASSELRQFVDELQDDRLRQLIERHYFGGETFETIAQDMGISKGWASRLHAKAVRILEKRMRESHSLPGD